MDAVGLVGGDENCRRIRRQRTIEVHALGFQGFDRIRQDQLAAVEIRRLVGIHGRFAEHGLSRIPAVFLEVVTHARADVRPIAPKIDMTIGVGIDRIAAIVRRHELRRTHGACIRPFDRQRVEADVARQQDELFQLVAEKRSTRRIIEGQRRERIQDTI